MQHYWDIIAERAVNAAQGRPVLIAAIEIAAIDRRLCAALDDDARYIRAVEALSSACALAFNYRQETAAETFCRRAINVCRRLAGKPRALPTLKPEA